MLLVVGDKVTLRTRSDRRSRFRSRWRRDASFNKDATISCASALVGVGRARLARHPAQRSREGGGPVDDRCVPALLACPSGFYVRRRSRGGLRGPQRETRPRAGRTAGRLASTGVAGTPKSATMGTPRLEARASIMVRVGLARPVSMRLRYVRKSPQRSARSSCVNPPASRSSRTRSPKARWGDTATRELWLKCTHSYTHSFIHQGWR